MDTEHLRLFLQIVERGSISGAARDFDLSPSLATRHLAKLEKSVGVPLLERTTRKLALTEAGRILVNWARKSLNDFDIALAKVSESYSKPTGLLRFVCPEMLASRFLSALTAQVAEQYPDIRFKLLTIDNIRDFPPEQFDAGIHIGTRPGTPFIARKVLDIQPMLCAAPSYIARYGVPTSPAHLSKHRLLIHETYHNLIWTFERRNAQIHQPITPYLMTTNSLLLHGMALQGVGVARLTRRIAGADVKAGRLVNVMPEYQCVSGIGEPSAIWVIRPNRYLTRRTRVFLDAVIKHLRNMR